MKTIFEHINEALTPLKTKGKWYQVDIKKYAKDIQDEFFNLISTAYAEIGGHVKVKEPSDVFKDPDWNYWRVADVDNDQDIDVITAAEKNPHGLKQVLVGHDGSTEAKKKYIEDKSKELKDRSVHAYAEVSGKLASILIGKYGVPIVNDPQQVQNVLNKSVEWHGIHPDGESRDTPGDGWYTRTIGGHPHAKIMVGMPK